MDFQPADDTSKCSSSKKDFVVEIERMRRENVGDFNQIGVLRFDEVDLNEEEQEPKPKLLTEVGTKSHRSALVICLVVGLAVIGATVIIIVVIVTMNTREHGRTSQPTRMPQIPTKPSCVFCVERVPQDFPMTGNESIWQLVGNASNHSLFQQLLALTATDQYLDNVTLFAPTDEAILLLPVPFAFYLSNLFWIYHLETVLSDHIVTEPLTSAQIFRLSELPTVSGTSLVVNDTGLTLGDSAKILLADVPAANGFIQVPDRVMLRDDLRQTLADAVEELHVGQVSTFTIFGDLLNQSGLQDLLFENIPTGLTLMIPTDAAFSSMDPLFLRQLKEHGNLTRRFILYHLVPFNVYQEVIISILQQVNLRSVNGLTWWFTAGRTQTLGISYANTNPIQQSRYAENGLVHVLSHVFVPPTIGDLLTITSNVTFTPTYDFKTFISLAQGPAQLRRFLFHESWTEKTLLTVFAPLQGAFDYAKMISRPVSTILNRPSLWWFHVKNLILHHCVALEINNAELVVGEIQLQMLSGYNISLQVVTVVNVTNDNLGYLNLLDGNFFEYPDFTIDGHANVTLNKLVAVNGYDIVCWDLNDYIVDDSLHFLRGLRMRCFSIAYGIDRLLLPPWVDSTVYETIVKMPELSIFGALVKVANMTSFLNDTSGLTLLAPNDGALSQVDPTNATSALALVLRHILPRNMYTSDFVANTSSSTKRVVSINQLTYKVEWKGDTLVVGGAQILLPDLLSSNGVLHVIDHVLTK